MNYRMVFYVLGRLFMLLAAFLCLPLLVGLIYRDGQFLSFLIPIGILVVIGVLLSLKKPQDTRIFAKEGFVIVALSWILMSLFGCLPFWFSGQMGNFFSCLFEIASGFTTTGASILTDVEVIAPSLNFWRCFSIWLGGMGVLVFLLAILPKVDDKVQSMHIFRAESPGPQVGKIVSKLSDTSRILYAIYFGLTLVQVILLLFGGLSFYESITCAMSTAGTGGFYIYNASIGHFGSAYVEMVVAVFMILFGCNFSIYYMILVGKIWQALKSEELRWYLGLLLGSMILIAVSLFINKTASSTGETIRFAIFQAASIMSTTGFSTTDFGKWNVFAQGVIMILMMTGASAGSTGGGMKVARLLLLGKSANRSFKKMLSPNSIVTVKFEGKSVDEATLNSVQTYFVLYMAIIVAGTLLVSLDGNDPITNLTAVITCLNNVGPGFSLVGPMGNYSIFSSFSKVILTLIMIAGRLELFPVAMLLYKRTWTRA